MFVPSLAVILLLSLRLHGGKASRAHPTKFLIASSPQNGLVSYIRIPDKGLFGTGKMTTLVSGLQSPLGLALDLNADILYVADVTEIHSYQLVVSGEELTAKKGKSVATGTELRWVAVDGVGNVFFTNEAQHQILKAGNVSAPEVVHSQAGGAGTVSAPGGIVLDSFSAYWVNKISGQQAGSVVKATQRPTLTSVTPKTLSNNIDKGYGICLAASNVFYTAPDQYVYGVKKTGGAVTTVTDKLISPRGCVWDGDGTVYVADRGNNAIFSFAGTMQTLGGSRVRKAIDFQSAYGVAVFTHIT